MSQGMQSLMDEIEMERKKTNKLVDDIGSFYNTQSLEERRNIAVLLADKAKKIHTNVYDIRQKLYRLDDDYYENIDRDLYSDLKYNLDRIIPMAQNIEVNANSFYTAKDSKLRKRNLELIKIYWKELKNELYLGWKAARAIRYQNPSLIKKSKN